MAIAEMRTWTDARRVSLEAELVGVVSGTATLRAKDGREIRVAATQLSPADQQYLAARDETPNAAPSSSPASDGTWPRIAALQNAPKVTVVREDAKTREFVYETEHYEFVSDSQLSANLVREFSRVFEVTWLANSLLPLDIRPEPEPGRKKFRARIFTNEADYLKAGGLPGSAGVYSRSLQALMLPLSSLGVQMVGSRVSINYQAEDYATLVHEVTHQMMNHWLGRLPLWLVEGSAEYVEMAEYTNGRLSFLRADKRMREGLTAYTGGRFPMVGLERLMTISDPEWAAALANQSAWQNYASARALTYYFYHLDGDGSGTNMIAFMRDVAKLPEHADATPLVEKHLLRGRSYAELEDDVRRAFRRLQVPVEFSGGGSGG